MIMAASSSADGGGGGGGGGSGGGQFQRGAADVSKMWENEEVVRIAKDAYDEIFGYAARVQGEHGYNGTSCNICKNFLAGNKVSHNASLFVECCDRT